MLRIRNRADSNARRRTAIVPDDNEQRPADDVTLRRQHRRRRSPPANTTLKAQTTRTQARIYRLNPSLQMMTATADINARSRRHYADQATAQCSHLDEISGSSA